MRDGYFRDTCARKTKQNNYLKPKRTENNINTL